ncbi:uncharacterized protein LOC143253691 isoform X2 [Tachypleus tridentatus]|uniref:uncharacterized protein LOC143253691 isoform X2 n=1 Tax=Tachypleus tridentatus TaxID=6853 RepID=UPI003FD1B83C
MANTRVNGHEGEGQGDFQVVHLEPRPLRPFKSSEEYLYAMKEDLADWLNTLYNLKITAENFIESLETGVVLCRHANQVVSTARDWRHSGRNGLNVVIPERDVVYRTDVQPGTFHARDNISNFITWCRSLSIMECLLFETDDLVLRKNEKSFVLCLLEVARRGSKLGMPAPLLVQMENEIDAELAKDDYDSDGHEADDDSDVTSTSGVGEPRPQIITNDLRSLHERILRNHVMVRVGGGWDTLEHYLDKHDPCQCRIGPRPSSSAKVTMTPGKGGSSNMKVTYNRSSTPSAYESGLDDSLPTSPQSRRRVVTVTSGQKGTGLSSSIRDIPPREPSRSSQYSDDSSASSTSLYYYSESPTQEKGRSSGTPRSQFQVSNKPSRPPSFSADSSSEFSEGESRASPRVSSQPKKFSPRKLYCMFENGEEAGPSSRVYLSDGCDSGFGPESSETSSVVSVDDRRRTKKSNVEGRVQISNDSSADSTFSNTSAPTSKSLKKSKSVSPGTPGKKTAPIINHKSQSTENLYSGRYTEKLQLYRQNSSGSSVYSRKGRSSIGDCTPSIPRSYSQTSDMGGFGSSLARNLPGRFSYKPPTDVCPKVDTGFKTWTFRQRPSRASISSDLYRLSCEENCKSTTNIKSRSAESSISSSPQKLSPAKSVSTANKMRKLLEDIDLYTDIEFFNEMQRFINSYREKVENKIQEEESENSDTGPSPVTCSLGSSQGLDQSQQSPKFRPRRESQGGSTKIPVPVWYNK